MVEPPGEHARHPSRQPGGDRGAVGLPGGVLVARPVTGKRPGTGEPGPRERHPLGARLGQQPVVGLRVQVGEAVVGLDPAGAVGVAQLVAPGVLATVGLEAVDADLLQEVAPSRQPPVGGLRSGEVGQQRAGEPPAAVVVRRAVGLLHGPAVVDQHVPVVGQLLGAEAVGWHVDRQDGDLPQQHLRALLVQAPDHPDGVGPGAVGGELEVVQPERLAVGTGGVARVPERGEGRLVGPRLDDDDPHRDALVVAALHLRLDPRLGVPLVARRPRPEHPAGHGGRLGGVVEEGADHLAGVAEVQRQVDRGVLGVQLDLDDQQVGLAGADVEPAPSCGVDVESPADRSADDQSEGHR